MPGAGGKPSIDGLEPLLRRALDALDQLAKAVGDPDALPSEVVGIAEAVSIARSEMYRELIRQGWVPPHAVPEGIDVDERLRSHGLGSGYDLRADAD